MSPTFNLISEPWIPILDGQARFREAGLRQVLAEAHNLHRIAASNALETASILRLLLAILHRTHDTSSRQAWGELWRQGQFDAAVMERYWAVWSERFDLFHPEHPFYQQSTDRKKPVSVAGFFPGLAAAEHFNHSVQMGEQKQSPAQAARRVLIAQTFGLSGGCLPAEKLSHKASPWVAGLIFFVEGDSLFQTLICNLLRYDEYSPTQELAQTDRDRPNWEADDPYEPRNQVFGYLDYLTWPSRRIWLIPENDGSSTVVRRYVDFVGLAPPSVLDPNKFYRRDEKSKNAIGHIPLYLSESKASWRSSSAIMRLHTTTLRPPVALGWLADLRREGAIRSPHTRLVGYGLVVESQTKVVLIRRDEIPLPLAYLDQSTDETTRDDLLSRLDTAIRQGEQMANALQAATRKMAETVCPTVGDGDPGQISRIARNLSSMQSYWASLERPFYQLMLDLPEAYDLEAIQARWLAEVLAAGRKALSTSIERAGQYPKALKAGVLACGLFNGILRKNGLSDISNQGEEQHE